MYLPSYLWAHLWMINNLQQSARVTRLCNKDTTLTWCTSNDIYKYWIVCLRLMLLCQTQPPTIIATYIAHKGQLSFNMSPFKHKIIKVNPITLEYVLSRTTRDYMWTIGLYIITGQLNRLFGRKGKSLFYQIDMPDKAMCQFTPARWFIPTIRSSHHYTDKTKWNYLKSAFNIFM